MSGPMPIFVLTLDGSETRRAPLLERLAEFGLRYELFVGIDGRRALPPEYEPLVDRWARVNRTRRPMTDGEYACALSHLFIYRSVAERGLSRAIVLEDDAIVGTTFAAFAQGEIGLAGDLLILDHRKGLFHRTGQIPLGQGLTAHRVAWAPFLTTGYAITAVGAHQLLARSFPVRHQADWPCDITRIASYGIHPRIVDHADLERGVSDIRMERQALHDARDRRRSSAWSQPLTLAFWRRRLAKRSYRRVGRRLDVPALLDREDLCVEASMARGIPARSPNAAKPEEERVHGV